MDIQQWKSLRNQVTSSTYKTRPTRHSIEVRKEKIYYLYILASQRRTLYIGVTSNIEGRVLQHKQHAFGGFTAQYNTTNLVHFERYGDVLKAIRREKELKAWRREKKIDLIESKNPKWKDLSYGWYQRHQFQPERKPS